jgi:hypothetical protein
VRGTNGCFSDTSNRINITNVSVDNPSEFTFMVYPNPTTGQVFAQVSSRTDDQIDIQVRNVVGQVVRQESIRTEQGIARVEWEMTAFPSGVYFVQLKNKGRLLRTEKLILRKP